MRALLLLCALAGSSWGQTLTPTTTTTPVPILKQVNRVNEDGSYTYGFEAADGSFKLETRDVNGEVTGKFGYVDANGQQQVFDYSASKGAGFSPSSDLIPRPLPGLPQPAAPVAPGTIVNGIDVALDGYSEDLDEDGFVDPIPTELLQRAPAPRPVQPVAPRARPAPRPVQPVAPRARPAPRPVQPVAPRARPAPAAPSSVPADTGLPAGTFRFTGPLPQAPVLRQPQPQPQRQLVPQAPVLRQPQPQPQRQFVPQPQQFVPQQQQFSAQQLALQQQQFAVQQQQRQFALQQQQAAVPAQLPTGAQRFFRPVQGFDARGVVNGFQPVPLNG